MYITYNIEDILDEDVPPRKCYVDVGCCSGCVILHPVDHKSFPLPSSIFLVLGDNVRETRSLGAAVDLISFSNILYGIYLPLFIVLLIYSLGGTAICMFLGKDLVTLNFMPENKESNFHYGLVQVQEDAESIAFYGAPNDAHVL
ncbi:hypothetical protein COCNU_03G013040 [Cocos nucifera]|uniref:ABC transmembrane type-1 domain-containing protein n=1 Tax=Cocos nucifera TaxID=13894 RepID=A0A8K0MZ56_COCNU|nr:hypothetical protein COCNU_03G013040 [Cocos nucifera]